METALFEFHPKDKPYTLIIGVFNEGEKFTRQLEALQPYRQFVDIIITDGNSSDGATSPEALRNKVSALLVNKEEQRGLSVQYRMALKFAYDRGYEGFIMMDGNGKDGVEAIPRFIEKLQERFDFIQGSRFMPGGIHKNTPLIRILGMRLIFNPLMYIASGFAYTDAMNGFKGYNRSGRYLYATICNIFLIISRQNVIFASSKCRLHASTSKISYPIAKLLGTRRILAFC